MANIDLSAKFKTKGTSVDEIKNFVKQRLNNYCKYKIVQANNTSLQITGKPSDSIWYNMTKFAVTFDFKIEDNVVRINMLGTSSANWVFWFFFIIGLFNGVTLLGAVIIYYFQRNKPKDALSGALKAIETEFGTL